MIRKAFPVLLAVLLAACSSSQKGDTVIQYENIEKHIAELASNKYKGR